jgi:N-acetylneuraminic acid mutarotase
MKKLLLLLMIGLFFVACNDDDDDDDLGNWIEQSDFEGLPRSNAVNFVVNNKVYIGTGYNADSDDEYLNDFWMYDPNNDSWVPIADFPGVARTGAVAFVINEKAYVGTGYNGKEKLNDFWEYDPVNDEWTRKADFAGTARYGAVGFALADKGYIGTGYDGNDTRDFWMYDPATDQWVQSVSMGGSKRKYAVAFTIGEKAYVCTGINNGIYQTDLWEFDPTTITWTQKIDLDDDDEWSITRNNGSAFTLNGKGYVTLGSTSGVLNDIWEYDPTADTWSSKTDFEGSARQEASAYVINNRAYVGLGRSGSYYFDDFWEFKPNEEYDDED